MEPTLEQSLSRIFAGRVAPPVVAPTTAAGPGPGHRRRDGARGGAAGAGGVDALAGRAAAGRLGWYGAEQKRLEEALRTLSGAR